MIFILNSIKFDQSVGIGEPHIIKKTPEYFLW